MISFSHALLFCGPPADTAKAVGALASATDLVHIACPKNRLPDLDCLPSLPNKRPLLALTALRNTTHLRNVRSMLDRFAIESSTVWTEPTLPSHIAAEFDAQDLEFTSIVTSDVDTPVPLSPARIGHSLAAANALAMPDGLELQIPLCALTLAACSTSWGKDADSCLEAGREFAQHYCAVHNVSLPRICPRCQKPRAAGLPCFSCGKDTDVRAVTLLPDERGYLIVGADAHDDLIARVICHLDPESNSVPEG